MSTKNAPLPKNLHRLRDSWRLTPVLAQAMPRLETNTRLSIHITELMPSTLKTGWRAHLEGARLTFRVPHQALAMKIKQQAPLIIDGLKIYGWDIQDIGVKVAQFNRPEWLYQRAQPEKNPPRAPLSAHSLASIAATVAQLPADAPARAALMRILEAQRQRACKTTEE